MKLEAWIAKHNDEPYQRSGHDVRYFPAGHLVDKKYAWRAPSLDVEVSEEPEKRELSREDIERSLSCALRFLDEGGEWVGVRATVLRELGFGEEK